MSTPFHERLRGLRGAARLSQEALARAAGLSTSGLSKIEQGRVDPAWSTVLRLAEALGIGVQDFTAEGEIPDRSGPEAARKQGGGRAGNGK